MFIDMIGERDLITFEAFPSDSVDPIRLEEFKTHPELIPIDWIIHRMTNTHTIIYKVESAYELFITNPLRTHSIALNPFNREPISRVFIDRIKLYHNVIERFGADFIPDYEQIKELFNLYIREEVLTDDQMLLLRRFIKIDDIIDIFGSMLHTESRNEYRSIAMTKLESKSDGSWLIRPSSISDDLTTGKIVRVLSFNYAKSIQNVLILHINGVGYLYNLVIARSSLINLFDYNTWIRTNTDSTFASIIDLLESKRHFIKLNSFVCE